MKVDVTYSSKTNGLFLVYAFLHLKASHLYIFKLFYRCKNLINKLCNDFSSYGYSVFDQNTGKFFEVYAKLHTLKSPRSWRIGSWLFLVDSYPLFSQNFLWKKKKKMTWLKILIFMYLLRFFSVDNNVSDFPGSTKCVFQRWGKNDISSV